MVEVIYDGGLGNWLFQYCFGRILAETLGYKLVAKPIPVFPGTYDLVDGHDFSLEKMLILRGQKPDLTFIKNVDSKYHLLLTGYFQRYEYYEHHAQRIRDWLAVKDHIQFNARVNDVILSIRRGRDYIPQYGLPISYYEDALASIDFDRVFICTNEPDDPFIQFLKKKYNATVRGGGFQRGLVGENYLSEALDNFLFIKKFNKIVISNSSFPWWAAFLSDASEIVFPRPTNGLWSPNDLNSKNISLEVNEDRYRYLNCEKYKSEFLSEIIRNYYDETIVSAKSQLKKWFPVLRKKRQAKEGRVFRFHEDSDDQNRSVGTTP